MADDATISSFLAFTGSSDVSRATSYLEMSGGELETAVSLYLEHHGSSGADVSGNSASDNNVGNGGANASIPGEVRAPDAAQRDRLLDVPENMGHFAPPMMMQMMGAGGSGNIFMDARAMANAMSAQERQRRNTWSDRVMRDDDSGDGDNDFSNSGSDDGKAVDSDDEVQERIESTRSTSTAVSTLSDIFSAPTNIMFRDGGFQGARNSAKENRKWLLVNVQNDADFACHALNRDVWRDELVINMVQEGFVFWQTSDCDVDGITYCQRYSVHGFPHIAILDPRTGRSMWKKEGWTQVNPLLASDFAQILSDFSSRHSFDQPPRAIPRRPEAGNYNGVASNKRPIESLTEDEQLQAAIAASMNEEKGAENMHIDLTEDDCNDEKDDSSSQEDKKPSFNDILKSIEVGDEPKTGPRIQFRLPDGKRIVRRFNADDKVLIIYAFIMQKVEDASSCTSFQLKAGFPPSDLLSKKENSISECDLSGAAVNVSWVD